MMNIRTLIAGVMLSSMVLLLTPTLHATPPQDEASSSLAAAVAEWIKNHPYLAAGASATAIASMFLAHSVRKLYRTNEAFKRNDWFELIAKGDIERINYQLEQGKADVNTTTDDGETALMMATKWGNIELINVLLKHGANAVAQDHRGETALMYAAIYAQPEAMAVLLDTDYIDDQTQRTMINQQDNLNQTALMLAIRRLYQNRMFNQRDDRMRDNVNVVTPHTRKKVRRIITLLADHNIDINLRDNNGRTALDLIVEAYNNHQITEDDFQFLSKTLNAGHLMQSRLVTQTA